jgi:imidazoleglycerol-phosphate dehydratase/histidinol-phosphatase
MKKLLLTDRDGTLVIEPADEQVDSFEKLEFYPFVFQGLSYIMQFLDYDLVMVTNQDGLGTNAFPEESFWPVQNMIVESLRNEGIEFTDVLIDRSFPGDKAPTRKPETGLLKPYMNGDYDLTQSVVIGDRLSDVQLAKNLGAKAILLSSKDIKSELKKQGLEGTCVYIAKDWLEIRDYLAMEQRECVIERKTKETKVSVRLKVDGTGKADVKTGLGFFDHMLEQIARHSGCDIAINTEGDLEVDEHHTIEDTALALGEALLNALGSKRGMERYGYVLPMDECLARVVIDFGGRNWIEWNAEFTREKVGDMPTEMFFHFFKSFSDAAKCNLNIEVSGENEHHKIEAVFKALGRAIRMAKKRDIFNYELPSTKGVL